VQLVGDDEDGDVVSVSLHDICTLAAGVQ
jgi:hypothetical protein